jgi:hypothetical protein
MNRCAENLCTAEHDERLAQSDQHRNKRRPAARIGISYLTRDSLAVGTSFNNNLTSADCGGQCL